MPDILTDEQAALIWSGQAITPDANAAAAADEAAKQQAAALAKTKADAEAAAKLLQQQASTGTEDDDDEDDDDPASEAAKQKKKDEELDKAFRQGLTPEEDEEDDDPAKQAGNKVGRKPSDLVSLVNQLIKDEELLPFEGVDEVKTIAEAKDLLKLNLSEREKTGSENAWKEKVSTYSPQVQTILHYAEQGAQSATEIMQLMGAIKNMEDILQFDDTTEIGQEQIVRQYYKSKGFKDNAIERQVSLLKDAGKDAIKEAAGDFLPDLQKASQDEIAKTLRDQEASKKRAEEASRVYLSTVKTALDKEKVGELKWTKEDKAKVFEAVANPKFTSINGQQTTQFVKRLEDIQFGDKQNYEHFLNIVHYTVDPQGFMDKLKQTLKNDVQEETQKALRTSKKNIQTSEQSLESNGAPRKAVRREFVNPFA